MQRTVTAGQGHDHLYHVAPVKCNTCKQEVMRGHAVVAQTCFNVMSEMSIFISRLLSDDVVALYAGSQNISGIVSASIYQPRTANLTRVARHPE